MTHPRFQIRTVYFVQRGNSSTLRIPNDLYNVEVWEGSRLLSTRSVAAFEREGEAQAEADRRQDEAYPQDLKVVSGGVRCPVHGVQAGAEYKAQDPAPCGCAWVWEDARLIAVPSRRAPS